jgi:hypothetical protein
MPHFAENVKTLREENVFKWPVFSKFMCNFKLLTPGSGISNEYLRIYAITSVLDPHSFQRGSEPHLAFFSMPSHNKLNF